MPTARLLAPRYWAVHLLALLCVLAAGGLGLWQWEAWGQRRDAEAADLTLVEPLALDTVIGPDDAFPGDKVGQPVIVSGDWVPEGTVFVSGREQDGVDGYWVVTPLATGGEGGSALLIVRGWTRGIDDAPDAPTGHAEFVAWLQPAEGTGVVDDDPSDDVLPQLRIADVLQHVHQDLYSAYAVVADEVAPGKWPDGDTAVNDGTAGLAPAHLDQLPEAGRFTAVRNLLYAIEWWFFGGFAVFVWVRWMRDELLMDD